MEYVLVVQEWFNTMFRSEVIVGTYTTYCDATDAMDMAIDASREEYIDSLYKKERIDVFSSRDRIRNEYTLERTLIPDDDVLQMQVSKLLIFNVHDISLRFLIYGFRQQSKAYAYKVRTKY